MHRKTITIRTAEALRLVHDGLECLEDYARSGVSDGMESLANACESLLSAVVFVLREPKAKVPVEMQQAIGTIREHLEARRKAA